MFILSDNTGFQIETKYHGAAPGAPGWVFFQESVHTPRTRIALVILAGAKAIFEPISIAGDERGLLTIGQALPAISDDGLVAKLVFRGESGDIPLASVSLPRALMGAPWLEVEFSLKNVAGRTGSLVLECDPGPRRDSTADWLAVYECVVSPSATFRRDRARAFQAWRTKNELLHMGRTYTEGDFYSGTVLRNAYERPELSPERIEELRRQSTNPYEMVHLIVETLVGPRSYQFHARLSEKVRYAKHPLRILSLCSGEARVETELMERSAVSGVKMTLVDVNPDLLARARRTLSRFCECETITADVNAMEFQPGAYDLIICVSGLHHLIELERVAHSMASALAPGGEFWSIGEYVGRNGARLWPEAYAIANNFFAKLPEQYRRNWTPGIDGKPDSVLPNLDCSISTFESIRSEDLEDCLDSAFAPVQLARHDCLLWRLFDPAYARNYDIQSDTVVALMCQAADLEIAHRMNGGRPTALNAIYRSRLS